MIKKGRRWKCTLMLFALLVLAGGLALFIQMYYSFSSLENSKKIEILKTINPTTKVILMHSFPWWYEFSSGKSSFDSCNQSCVLTLDSELVTEADTVVVYSHPFQSGTNIGLHSPTQKQTWVYFAVESPVHSRNYLFAKPEWHNSFNWTMTYRRDSDMYFGYGDLVRKPASTSPEKDILAIVSGKSKMVAWFVSNCDAPSKRGDIAAALKDFVQVDIYGKCGDLKCATDGDDRCFSMLSKDYYFYLSFENSLCKDYVTEKLYRIMKKVDIIPVVYGGANYSALFPNQSYIDVRHFATIRELADYLKKVASDRKLYASYFEWKKELNVLEPTLFPFCDLCWRSHHPENFHKVYENVDAWWKQGTCWEPKAFVKS